MSYMTAGKLQAFEALMKEVPGFDHYDSGCDGICPECRKTPLQHPLPTMQSIQNRHGLQVTTLMPTI